MHILDDGKVANGDQAYHNIADPQVCRQTFGLSLY